MIGPSETIVRASLWLTAPFNLLAAYTFSFPSSGFGQLLGLPSLVHPFYAYFSGAMVGLFGLAYVWMAGQTAIDHALLFVGACGKSLAVVIALALFLQGNLAPTLALLISGDVLFAGLWFFYLFHQRSVGAD